MSRTPRSSRTSRRQAPPAGGATAMPERRSAAPGGETAWIRWTLVAVAIVFLLLVLFLPLTLVFVKALEKGVGFYLAALSEPDARAAIRLTLLVAAFAVPCNLVFGLVASWLLARFDFTGKNLLLVLIDLPFCVSPVISGLVFILLFGAQGLLGRWLTGHGVQLVFSVTGIVLATVFVTFPYVARELIPLMQSQGSDEEEAAVSLGATGFQVFWRVTLPNCKWGLLYGVVLCNARAMGEFGAVSVVSGHIRGLTNTVPLHVEILYNEYNFTAAFAVASLLVFLALVTLALKRLMEVNPQERAAPDADLSDAG
jgi:sulfate/thiosulfate transport system permease protein